MLTETLRRVGPVTGQGITRIDFAFKIFSSDDVLVIRSTNGVESTLTILEDYTVTWNTDQVVSVGGYITLTTPITAGESVTLLSAVPYTQNLDLHSEGDFDPQSINKELDRQVAQIQQLKELVGRAAIVPVSEDKSGEDWGKELVNNSELSAQYAAQAQASATTAAAAASIAQNAQDALDASTYRAELAAQSANYSAQDAANALLQAQAAAESATNSADVARQSTYGFRYCDGATAGASVLITDIYPSTNVKAGDHLVNSVGQVFRIVSTTALSAMLSAQITSIKGDEGPQGNEGVRGVQGATGATFTPALDEAGNLSWTNDRGLVNPATVNIKGPRGDKGEDGEQGEPGPTGDVGKQGPMGEAPWANAFGQFRIEDSYLKLDYVGVTPAANFTINENGQLEATV